MELKDFALLNLVELARCADTYDTRYNAWSAIPDKSLISINDLIRIGKTGEHKALTREVCNILTYHPKVKIADFIEFISFNKSEDVVNEIWKNNINRHGLTQINDLVTIILSYVYSYGITQEIVNEAYQLAIKHPNLSEKHLCSIAFDENVCFQIRDDAEERLIKIDNLNDATLISFCVSGISELRRTKAWFIIHSSKSISFFTLQNIAHNAFDILIKDLACKELASNYFKQMAIYTHLAQNEI
jgi:hypothetical protein